MNEKDECILKVKRFLRGQMWGWGSQLKPKVLETRTKRLLRSLILTDRRTRRLVTFSHQQQILTTQQLKPLTSFGTWELSDNMSESKTKLSELNEFQLRKQTDPISKVDCCSVVTRKRNVVLTWVKSWIQQLWNDFCCGLTRPAARRLNIIKLQVVHLQLFSIHKSYGGSLFMHYCKKTTIMTQNHVRRWCVETIWIWNPKKQRIWKKFAAKR